jgi:hypothetical protein
MSRLEALQAEFAEGLLAVSPPAELAGGRAGVYRHLIEHTLDGCMTSILPRATARLGAVFFEHARAFYAARGPQTHYLRDVPSEFLAWVGPRWEADPRVPAYLHDLARHEAAAIEIAAAPEQGGASSTRAAGELSLGRAAVFIEAARVARYDHAVHELSGDPDDRAEPEARAVWLLIYRDAEHELRYLALSPAAAAILERMLRPGVTVERAIVDGAAEAGVPVDEALLSGTSVLLADLAERGVLLGGSGLPWSGQALRPRLRLRLCAVEDAAEREPHGPVRRDLVEERAVEGEQQADGGLEGAPHEAQAG